MTSSHWCSGLNTDNNEGDTKIQYLAQPCTYPEAPSDETHGTGHDNDDEGDIRSAERTVCWDLDDHDVDEIDDQEMRDLAGHLVDAALYILLGIPRRRKGLRLVKLDNVPSLIQLAPSIWNAHYLKVWLPKRRPRPIY